MCLQISLKHGKRKNDFTEILFKLIQGKSGSSNQLRIAAQFSFSVTFYRAKNCYFKACCLSMKISLFVSQNIYFKVIKFFC